MRNSRQLLLVHVKNFIAILLFSILENGKGLEMAPSSYHLRHYLLEIVMVMKNQKFFGNESYLVTI